MKKLVGFLLVLTILAIGTQQIKLPYLSMSFLQIMIIVTTIVSVPYVFAKGLKQGTYLITCIIWFFSSIIALFLSINPEWAKGEFLLSMMTVVLLFVMPNYYERIDIEKLEKWLIRSQYIVIPLSLYSWMIFYSLGAIPEVIPLPLGMSIHLSEEALARGTSAGEVRLMMPYNTPPVLSVVMSMCITMLLFSKELFGRIIKLTLILLFSVILVFTGSRTGIIGFSLLILFLFFKGQLRRIVNRVNKGQFILLILIVGVAIFFAMQTEYFQKMVVSRFSSANSNPLEDDRHFLVPLDGILIWLDSISNFVFGIGFGSSAKMMGAHTELPPHFLNSYVTLLTERGLLGLLLDLLLIGLVLKLFTYRKRMTKNELALVYTLFVGMASGIFYETLDNYFVIFIIAISYMLLTNVSNDLRRMKKSLTKT